MPARLIIQAIDLEDTHWIEVPVLRIGSRPDCDVQIEHESVPGHAITVEYRDKKYLAYNRSNKPVYIDGIALAAGSSTPFGNGQLLRLDGDVGILMDIDGDPSPSSSPDSSSLRFEFASTQHGETYEDLDASPSENAQSEDELFDSEELDAATSTTPDKSMIQLGVISLCVAGIALALFLKTRSSDPTEQRAVPTLYELMELAMEGGEMRSEADWKDGMLRQLQYAERALLRGQQEEAREGFYALRDELARHNARQTITGEQSADPLAIASASAEGANRTFVSEVEAFIKSRLTTLKSK